jgi:hypothetical protein
LGEVFRTCIRVSSSGDRQVLDLQRDALLTAGVDARHLFEDETVEDLGVGSAITEGKANFLVNRRMNKSQQMRWSRRGADLLLQVRCAVYNGTLGCEAGQKFRPANDPCPPMAIAA